MEKRYCPMCGADVTDREETEYGIFCPSCGNDFWLSETITDVENYVHVKTADYEFMIHKNAFIQLTGDKNHETI
jgi:hypothetical protein